MSALKLLADAFHEGGWPMWPILSLMIHSFAGVAGVDPSMKATLLAKGISEAMNCTAFGLITAIPALLAFAILNGWTQGILDDINEVSVQVVNLVVGHRNAMKGGQAA